MRSILIILLISQLNLAHFAQASSTHSSYIADPPNTIEFKTITLKNVKAASVDVPKNCDENYRAVIESAAQTIWQQCSSVGKSEASTCQRDLFQQCTETANKLRSLQPSTCSLIISQASQVNGGAENYTTQSNSQESNNRVNTKAAKASESIASKLENDAQAVQQLLDKTKKTLSGISCLNSSAAASYLKVTDSITSSLQSAKNQLSTLSNQKKLEAKSYAGTASTSELNQINMKTAKVTDALNNKSQKIAQGSSALSNSDLLKIAAIGLPATALLGLSASGIDGYISGLHEGVDATGSGSEAPTTPDGNFQNIEGLFIDPSFTDQEKAKIVEGYRRMPDCYKSWIKNIAFVNKNLGKLKSDSSQCVAGRWTAKEGRQKIYLSPSCYGTRVSDVIHEYMHSLGFRNGHKLHEEFKNIRNRYQCNVSDYAKTNLIEDFAETALQSIFPSPPGKSNGPCIGEKVRATRQLLDACK